MLEFAAVIALLVLSGGALAGALVLTRRARLEREARIAMVAVPEPGVADAAGHWLKTRTGRLDVKLQRVFAIGTKSTWGMTIGAVALTAIALAAATAGWALTHMVLRLPVWLALPGAALIGFYIPRALLLRQQKKADRQFTDLFPDAVDAIARMLRAGLPISSAVRSVSADSPAPINSVFAMVADQMAIGTPIEEALDASSRHIGLPDFRFFTVAVVLQHLTGGNLAATLEVLSDIVRKRRAVRMKSRATTAEIRVSAYVLGSMPLLVIGALLLMQPNYLAPLFVDPRGQVILTAAGFCLLAAGLTMRQMMRSVTED